MIVKEIIDLKQFYLVNMKIFCKASGRKSFAIKISQSPALPNHIAPILPVQLHAYQGAINMLGIGNPTDDVNTL